KREGKLSPSVHSLVLSTHPSNRSNGLAKRAFYADASATPLNKSSVRLNETRWFPKRSSLTHATVGRHVSCSVWLRSQLSILKGPNDLDCGRTWLRKAFLHPRRNTDCV